MTHPTRVLGRTLVCACALCCTCTKDDRPRPQPKASAEQARHGLSAEQAGEVLVEVGNRVITLGDFADRLADQSPYLRARYASPERRREFLENLIRFELLAYEAERRGYEDLPEVQRVRQQAMVQQMMSQLFDEGAIAPEDITDAEIAEFYRTHRDEFHKPRQVRASHIMVKSRPAAKRVLAAVLRQPDDMARFRRLAGKHNQDPATADRFGDLRFFGETADAGGESLGGDVPAAVRKAAFGLTEVGQVYPELVESEQGFHIVKLTAKRQALDRGLEAATRMIRNRLWREKRQAAIEAFVADLRRKANVQEDLSLLTRVKAPAGPTNPEKQTDDETRPRRLRP